MLHAQSLITGIFLNAGRESWQGHNGSWIASSIHESDEDRGFLGYL